MPYGADRSRRVSARDQDFCPAQSDLGGFRARRRLAAFRARDRSGGPAGSHNQGIVSITHTPGFSPADIAQYGPAVVVYGHDKEAAEAQADRLAGFIREQEQAFAGRLYTPDEAVTEAMRLARTGAKPVVLADIQDNPAPPSGLPARRR